jgi:FKBP-type peptidyl-prolyl cis-trans isomerase FkpA
MAMVCLQDQTPPQYAAPAKPFATFDGSQAVFGRHLLFDSQEHLMNQFLRKTLMAASVMAAVASVSVYAADAQLKTDKDKSSYMVGMDVGKGLSQIKDELDISVVIQAMQSVIKGDKPALSDEEYAKVRKEFAEKLQAKQAGKAKEAAEKNKAEGDAYLAKNKTKAGVKTTASGLQYEVVTEGKGAKPKASDTVKVNYTGTKIDGTKFDASADHGGPATFPLSGVIPGWTEALQIMPVGSKYKFTIPADLAYRDHAPDPIGPNATLLFDVELVSIEKPEAAAAPAPAAPPVKK